MHLAAICGRMLHCPAKPSAAVAGMLQPTCTTEPYGAHPWVLLLLLLARPLLNAVGMLGQVCRLVGSMPLSAGCRVHAQL